jgi:hypothetical protein
VNRSSFGFQQVGNLQSFDTVVALLMSLILSPFSYLVSNRAMPKATDINKLPPFPKGMGSGSALGFTIDEDDPTIRYKIWYGREEEKAFCECSELCSSKQWKEAKEKFDKLS